MERSGSGARCIDWWNMSEIALDVMDRSDPLEELFHENETLDKVVARVRGIGAILRQGGDVPAEEITAVVRLLAEYWTVHARRFDADMAPEARPWVRYVGRARCSEHLDRIQEDRPVEAARIRGVLDDIGSAVGCPSSNDDRARLGKELIELAGQVDAALHYETEYPLSCLFTAMPREVVDRVNEKFADSAARLRAVERQADEFIERSADTPVDATWTLNCSHPGCGATAIVGIHPRAAGGVSLDIPVGWRIHPRGGAGREPATPFEGCCPLHVTESDRAKFSSKAIDTRGDDGRPSESARSELAGDPDPECSG